MAPVTRASRRTVAEKKVGDLAQRPDFENERGRKHRLFAVPDFYGERAADRAGKDVLGQVDKRAAGLVTRVFEACEVHAFLVSDYAIAISRIEIVVRHPAA
jgi:hypothetical protein